MIPTKPYRWFWVTALFFIFLGWHLRDFGIDIQMFDIYLVIGTDIIMYGVAVLHLIYGYGYWFTRKHDHRIKFTKALHLWSALILTGGTVFYWYFLRLSPLPISRNFWAIWNNILIGSSLFLIGLAVLGIVLFMVNIMRVIRSSDHSKLMTNAITEGALDKHLQNEGFDTN